MLVIQLHNVVCLEMGVCVSSLNSDDYEHLLELVTGERLGSYFRAHPGNTVRAFELYEWNMRASAAVMELTGMVEIIVRNALGRELTSWAGEKRSSGSWFDVIPLDSKGASDVVKARGRATLGGKRSERHGRVVAELSFGFWRYLVEPRYFTSLWVPATHNAFPSGTDDLRERQKAVKARMQQLHFIRNRVAHHEPIHQRKLAQDVRFAVDLAEWVSPTAARWFAATSVLPKVIGEKP